MVRHRIVQHRGRRYSIKLEDTVWQTLDSIAENLGIRLNQLIGQVAGGLSENSSLTAALRTFCLERTLDRIVALQQDLDDRSLVAHGIPIATIVEACPSPCLLVQVPDQIMRINEAARVWFGADDSALIGRALGHYLQIRSKPRLEEILDGYRSGDIRSHGARVVYLRPGRLVMARASICPAVLSEGDDMLYLVMIDNAPHRQ